MKKEEESWIWRKYVKFLERYADKRGSLSPWYMYHSDLLFKAFVKKEQLKKRKEEGIGYEKKKNKNQVTSLP